MTKIIDVEILETEIVEASDLIKVTQVPQVEFTQLKQYNIQLVDRLARLDLANLEANEDNLKEIKTTRTDIRKELKVLEDSRKLTEKTILEPYKNFENEYNKLIKTPLQDADKDLKAKVDEVEDDLRKEKTNKFINQFNNLKLKHNIDFVTFENAKLNIQLSTSENQLEQELDTFFEKVINDLAVIETNTNKERVLVKYMQDLDLSNAIVTVDREIKQEEELIAKREADKIAKEQAELQREQATEPITKEIKQEPTTNIKAKEVAPELLTMSFTVTGTKEQLISVREYMKGNNIQYV